MTQEIEPVDRVDLGASRLVGGQLRSPSDHVCLGLARGSGITRDRDQLRVEPVLHVAVGLVVEVDRLALHQCQQVPGCREPGRRSR